MGDQYSNIGYWKKSIIEIKNKELISCSYKKIDIQILVFLKMSYFWYNKTEWKTILFLVRILMITTFFWRNSGVSLKGRVSRLPEQPSWLYTLIALQQHLTIPRKYHPTENWLSSRCLTSMIIRELVFPSWHQPLTTFTKAYCHLNRKTFHLPRVSLGCFYARRVKIFFTNKLIVKLKNDGWLRLKM